MRDTSLEDFLGDSDEGDTDADPDPDSNRDADPDSESEPEPEPTAGGAGTESDDGTPTSEAGPGREVGAEAPVEPATATYAWAADGADCPQCGATVERRWRDDDRLVCADCKNW